MNKEVIIFGASKTGATAYGLLSEEYDIIGFADNDSKKWGQVFCEKPIYSPEELKEKSQVLIVIASVYYSLIHKQLRDMGIEDILVFYYLGSASYKNSNNFRLYKLPDTKLFKECEYNEELISDIKFDFSKNYGIHNVNDRLKLPDTGRKKVLFCAYIFPPLGGSGVQRSLKFVKYLRKYGYEPIVLTVGENDGKLPNDTTLLQEIPEDVTVIRVDNTVFLPECLSKEEQQEIYNLYCGITGSKAWMEEYTDIINKTDARLIPDNQMIWVNQCLKHIESIIDINEIDVIYTTGNPYSDYVIGYYLKNKYHKKWVQDYRDPWTANQYYLDEFYNISLTEKLQTYMENSLVNTADATIVLAEALAEDFVNKFNVNPNQLHLITNGYDEADFFGIEAHRERNERFTLCYNGTIYINRNPLGTLEAINQLISDEVVSPREIRWIFNGALEEKWKKQINDADRYNIVEYNGNLSHHDSIVSAINSDMLVLFGATGEGAMVVHTGKVFEYLRMKRNILCLSSKGGILEQIMEETRAGENYEYEDTEGIKDYILRNFTQWKSGKQSNSIDEGAIKKYSREYATMLLSKVFDTVLEKV